MHDAEKINQWLRFSKDLLDCVHSKGKSGEYVLSFFTFSLRTPTSQKQNQDLHGHPVLSLSSGLKFVFS